MTVVLERLQRKRDFYAKAPPWMLSIWATPYAFEWFVKSRRAELAKAGAIHKLGRDWFVDVEVFPGCVVKIFHLEPAEIQAQPSTDQVLATLREMTAWAEAQGMDTGTADEQALLNRARELVAQVPA